MFFGPIDAMNHCLQLMYFLSIQRENEYAYMLSRRKEMLDWTEIKNVSLTISNILSESDSIHIVSAKKSVIPCPTYNCGKWEKYSLV